MMRTFIRLLLTILLLAGSGRAAYSQNGTLMPMPKFTGFDNNGRVINGGKLCTYAAGTSTPQATYSDVGLMTPNANPVVLDPAGRATVFLSATSYKFVLRQPGTTTDCTTGTILWTQDHVSSIPLSAANVSVLGTAGQALTAGQVVYLSDGSGGKSAGQWYPADSTNTYSSTLPTIGIVPTAISSASNGTITLAGTITGLTSLTIGSDYFVSTGGALVAAAPTNRRYVGRADTVTSLVLAANPTPQYVTGLNVAQGGTGAATLTAHGVLLGEGTTAIVPTAAMTTGQVLVGVTGADPIPTAATSVGAWQLVTPSASTGTDTSAGATTVATAVLPTLTNKDRVLIYIDTVTVAQPVASLQIYSVTDAAAIGTISSGATTAGEVLEYQVVLQVGQASNTSYHLSTYGRGTTLGAQGTLIIYAATAAWTSGPTIGLRHTGVTAGGTLQWSWSVYVLKGQ